MVYVPKQAIVTGCVEGCSARVEWSYDPGEPRTYWEPGCPEWFEPLAGPAHVDPSGESIDALGVECDHLDALVSGNDYGGKAGELYRQLWQWEQMRLAAHWNASGSREYLLGRLAPTEMYPRLRRPEWLSRGKDGS